MERPEPRMVLIERFLRTRPGITCERQKADAAMQNTYWRLDELNGERFPKEAGRQEPHLVLETNDAGTYRTTVGCNRMRGSYALAENALRFSPSASTMMACPEPLNSLERTFREALAGATSFAIERGNAGFAQHG